MAQPSAEPVEDYECVISPFPVATKRAEWRLTNSHDSYESLPPNFSLLQNMAAGAFAGIAVWGRMRTRGQLYNADILRRNTQSCIQSMQSRCGLSLRRRFFISSFINVTSPTYIDPNASSDVRFSKCTRWSHSGYIPHGQRGRVFKSLARCIECRCRGRCVPYWAICNVLIYTYTKPH